MPEGEILTGSPEQPALSPAAAPAAGALRRRLGDRTNEQVGRYTLLAQIAEGGMGAVYVALMRGPADFSRLVAIKCVHTRWLDDPRLVARFKSEIQLSARVLHPNVVQSLDVVETDGELFLVMDYVDGVTLAALLGDLSRQNEPLAIGPAVSIVASTLRGLHAAHEARDETGRPLHIVHRDVSPQNIMVGRNGHVQVLDFGVARVLEHSQHTAVGTMLGRLAYMAPEQLQGASSSPRTDVFGAGVVLWECLAGKRLFQRGSGTEAELIFGLLSQAIPRLAGVRPDVSPALDAVLARALERNAEQRFQSADEFARALEAAAPFAPPSVLSTLVAQASGARLTAREALIQRTRQELQLASPQLALQAPLGQLAEGKLTERKPAERKPAEIVTVKTPAFHPPRRRSSVERRLPWLISVAAAAGAAWFASRGLLDRAALSAAPAALLLAPPAPSAPVRDSVVKDGVLQDGVLQDGAQNGVPRRERDAVQDPVPGSVLEQDLRALAPAGTVALDTRKAAPASRRPSATRRRGPAGSDPVERRAEEPPTAGHDPCDPPTYVGQDGFRHFKKSCL